MSDYLYQHYKGKYRVLADYDLDTNDFPRDEHGIIDPDFNDYYIQGKKGIQIRHAGRDKLGCYALASTPMLANNVLKTIYKQELDKEPPKKMETLEKHLLAEDVILDITHYDDGALFIFRAAKLDDWAKIFKLKTCGATISPLSPKNLPKSTYTIPEEDEAKYKALFPNGLEALAKGKIAKAATATIKDKFTKKQLTEMKKLCMKPRQYIHYIGKWDKLLEEIQKEIENASN